VIKNNGVRPTSHNKWALIFLGKYMQMAITKTMIAMKVLLARFVGIL